MNKIEQSMELPDYKELPPEVAERFGRIYARPVMLDVEHLGRVFSTDKGSVVALQDINLKAHRRELLTIIGPSGCGKSTLIRILAGLDEPSSGQIKVDGAAVAGPGRDRGMVFQGYTLFPWRTVLKNVMFGPEMAGRGVDFSEEEARHWIEIVGLSKFADAYPHQLSGGMKQRVAIARALANHPRVLLMDEPFGALDAQTRAQMQSYLLELWSRVDITIVFVTHDLDEAVYLADRVVVLAAHPGRIAEIVQVPLPRPRDPQIVADPRFVATRRHLEHLIHGKRELKNLESLPHIRMTHVDDNVF
jgi:NitT/TauT family transport system ATP-binding protein